MADAPSLDDKARYEALKKELLQALPKKRAIDKQLAEIEFQIHDLEKTYLTETAAHNGGNIINGFEGYLKNTNTNRRKYDVADHERLFSNSSLTYPKSLELLRDNDVDVPEEGSHGGSISLFKQPSSTPGVTTVIVPPATRGQELDQSTIKKYRDREYQRRKRASASVSQRSTSDEETVTSSSRRATKKARLGDE
ncbi:histone acetyltransferase subunit NuA4-domain-containing protein [Mycena alexandri]|uniref:Chromatin modification-related protein EAF6 n=1 Tax=Mycena alexandri TaxID=1745969 RepID=A0AAD6TJJ6_9AGAR|nr:histone acetyltransferase subunit NuA4-domain-containing protein [Mycena alexandri]